MFSSLTHSFPLSLSQSLLPGLPPPCMRAYAVAWLVLSLLPLLVLQPQLDAPLPWPCHPCFLSLGPFHPLIFTCTSLTLTANRGRAQSVWFHKVPVLSICLPCVFVASDRPAREL